MDNACSRTPSAVSRVPMPRILMQKGVTLVEMATVVSVLLILAALAVPELNNLVERGRRQNAIDGAAALAGALEMYRTEWTYYPVTSNAKASLHLYEEITRYDSAYDTTIDVDSSWLPGVKGYGVYTKLTGTACIYSVVYKITPLYKVTHCVKTDSTWTQTQDVQPACCWTKGSPAVDCSSGTSNWYPCKNKM